jgi:hypothetical protein
MRSARAGPAVAITPAAQAQQSARPLRRRHRSRRAAHLHPA